VLRRTGARLLCTALLLLLAACSKPAAVPLPNDAYIWQRAWTPELVAALTASRDTVHGWRVLAAEMDRRDQWQVLAPDWRVLAALKQPLFLVVRIDARVSDWDQAALLDQVLALQALWRAHGVAPVGIEIDHDCGTAHLGAYAQFLQALRLRLGAAQRLSITVLPAWLDSRALDAVLAPLDEAVLQVHAVQDPRVGLFDAGRAQAWMRAFGARMPHAWRVALPAYGTRVSWDAAGHISAIESERPALQADGIARELLADPAQMAAFVAHIERDPPPRLAGIAWFRLPTVADERAWSLATWHAVLSRTPLQGGVAVHAEPGGQAGLYDVVLHNTGNLDVDVPQAVRIDGACDSADGINGYVLQRDAQGMWLQRTQAGLLRAGRQRGIGWLRCDSGKAQVHVQP
jgi:hypothetical protein